MESGGVGPTFAVAFGGGGARGLAHIHVIEALDELGIRPVAIAGSSIGAIMGAAMSAGMTGQDMHDFAHAVLSRRSEVTRRIWRARPGTLSEFVSVGLRVTQFNIPRILTAFLPEVLPARFEDLAIPLQVTATDYYAQEAVVFDSGDLHSALCASAAIPAVFQPIAHDGRLLVDGGISNPVPFDLLAGKADYVIAIDVVGGPEEQTVNPTSVDLLFGATQIMMNTISQMKLRQSQPAIYLRPPVSRYRALDFLKIDQVLADTASVKDELKRAIEALTKAAA